MSSSEPAQADGRERSIAPPAQDSRQARIQIGIDVGGTKIEAAALDSAGAFLSRVRAPNPGDYDSAIETIRDLVARVEREAGGRGTIGVGAPGSISPRTGVMRNANTTWLNGRSFREDLVAALGRDVRMANDANCLALSEAVDGAAAGARVAFAIILGTGCGGGLAIDGSVVEGAHGVGGEWGHTPLPWPKDDEFPGPLCWCGQRNCLELWVSGSGFQRDYAAQAGRILRSEEIVAQAEKDEAAASAALDRYIDRLGRAMAMICNIVDPDAFVLGGGMSNVAPLYERLPDVIRAYVFSDLWDGAIAPARWGDSSGVRGAARLWPAEI